ncbi:MAG: hypothetical protein Q4D45_10330 [Lachnospiraceae bacterium]|nr:hypothetical protein [Lachnospiraceae bacterium]
MLCMLVFAGIASVLLFLAVCSVSTDREAEDKEQLEWIEKWRESHKQI